MVLIYMKKGLVLVISDILSLITVVLCLIQKLPQIRDLYAYKSARGKLFVQRTHNVIYFYDLIRIVCILHRYQFAIIISGAVQLHSNDAI